MNKLVPLKTVDNSAKSDAIALADKCGGAYKLGMFFQRAETAVRLNGLEAARAFFSGCLAESDVRKEILWVAHLDDQARCIHLSQHDGHGSAAGLPLRQLIHDIVRLGSAGIVLAHNHPSGELQPSKADHDFTRRLVSISEAVDVALLDHLILAGDECCSMRAMGWL